MELDKILNISDRLLTEIDRKQNPCCVGLDPVVENIPSHLIEENNIYGIANAFFSFNKGIIDAVADLVPAVKPQIAFYEKYGLDGFKAFQDTVDYAKSKGLIVIEDGKRNDIAKTAKAYADGHLGKVNVGNIKSSVINVDMLTINPYLGTDGIKPFAEVCKEYGKGVFVLVKTSNPSSGDFQDRLVAITEEEFVAFKTLGVELSSQQTQLYNLVALKVNEFSQQLKGQRGYSSIGAVVGATYPKQAEVLRKIMPDTIFLVPGYGTQGATADDVMPCFNNDGYGALVNNSSAITFAYQKLKSDPKNYAEAARDATKLMIEDIRSALYKANKFPKNWKR